MPSTRKMTNKAGKVFYEITVRRGREKARLTSRWYPPEGWSQRAIDRELTKVAAEFERQCKAGEVVSREEKRQQEAQEAAEAAKIQTLYQFGERVFMPAKTVTLSENSRCSYQGCLDRWIYPALGEQKLPDISPADVTALLLQLQAQGKAHSSVVKCYVILSGLFKMAYLSDMIPRNPMDKAERPKPRKDEVQGQEIEAYTAGEVRYILDCLKEEPLKWQVFLRLLIDTGIRRGECGGLQWRDIDFQKSSITICRNLCYTPQKGVYLDTPKNGHTRIVDIDPEIIALLRALRQEQAESAISAFVFTQDGSPEPMHPHSPVRYMQNFSKRYGIPDLHPHKLRHTFASVAITAGADVASVSEKLGHSDKAVTLRMYTHANQESIRQASQIFRQALKKAAQE